MIKILLVEDDEALAMGIEYSLKSEGFSVSIANNINMGKEFLNKEEFHLVLLDVTLPDGSGYDLCKYIRTNSDMPIIFLTACDDEVNIVLGLDLGGDDYITKPFRLRELISRIKAVMRRKKPKLNIKNDEDKKDIIISHDIELHTLKAQVFKNGQEIFLTPAEYKLLLMFMQNPNIALERQQILEKLWDSSGEFVDDNTLSVYIKRLREKVEDKPSKPVYIKTIRGIGYKWSEDLKW